jgi:hypothetical protein
MEKWNGTQLKPSTEKREERIWKALKAIGGSTYRHSPSKSSLTLSLDWLFLRRFVGRFNFSCPKMDSAIRYIFTPHRPPVGASQFLDFMQTLSTVVYLDRQYSQS